VLDISVVTIVIARIEQKTLIHERRDLLVFIRASFSVQWFACRTLKRGVALVHVSKIMVL